MIAWMARYMASVPSVFIDGLLYTLIAMFTFSQAYFGGDEAAKYIPPEVKFWLNAAIGSGASVCAALKMFRSNSFANHQEEKKKESDTQMFRRTNEPGPTP